ncbi:hypothetical protein A2U01_0074477, partial [Trifolium medium]|nr:hypothetical protein [Trifolium medium]
WLRRAKGNAALRAALYCHTYSFM